MKPTYDNYEIHGRMTVGHDLNRDPMGGYASGRLRVEQCDDSEAEFWTLYGHIPGEGVQAITPARNLLNVNEAIEQNEVILFHERGRVVMSIELPDARHLSDEATASAHSCAAWVVWRDGLRLDILDSVGSIG